MINWTLIKPALIELFTQLAVDQTCTDWEAAWDGRSQVLVHPEQEQELLLTVTSCATIGTDERRYCSIINPDTGLPEIHELNCGLRRVNIQLRSSVAENLDDLTAEQTLERVRTRLGRQTSLSKLLSVGVGLIEVGQANDVSASFSKRKWSVGVMDVLLCVAVNDLDPIPTGTIETVIFTANVNRPDGSAIPPVNSVFTRT